MLSDLNEFICYVCVCLCVVRLLQLRILIADFPTLLELVFTIPLFESAAFKWQSIQIYFRFSFIPPPPSPQRLRIEGKHVGLVATYQHGRWHILGERFEPCHVQHGGTLVFARHWQGPRGIDMSGAGKNRLI